MIRITSDWSKWDKELDRLESLPNGRTNAALEAVLAHGFALSQAAIHVETGSLKGSETMESKEVFGNTWIGQLKVGGPTTGPKNPVNYAIYEKARGGDHDFFDVLQALHPEWVMVMLMGLRK